MNLWVTCVAAALVVGGCRKDGERPAESQTAQEGSLQAAAPAREAVRTPEDPPGLPRARYEELPGWLAFATVPPQKGKHYWSPSHPQAEAVSFSEAWAQTPKGTKVLALAGGELRELTYLGTSKEPYGCEENTQELAGFDAPAPLPEGPLWLLPPSASRGAAAVRIEGGAMEGGGKRSWQVAGVELVALRTGELKGRLELREAGKVVDTLPIEKAYMEGADNEPLDLANDQELGVPFPIAAWRWGEPPATVILLSRRGYEGQMFQPVLKRPGQPARALKDVEALYFCAF